MERGCCDLPAAQNYLLKYFHPRGKNLRDSTATNVLFAA
jgi:hypothetical protein